jgi:YegS/Rv2252/BmrU family lipid kinase
MKKIRFIVNPKSGTGKKDKLVSLIDSTIDKSRYETEVVFTQSRGHATALSREAADAGAAIVVAVGGDGSVNETAASLKHRSTSLAIIPTGSGNGMALHLGIPTDMEEALRVINTGHTVPIDTLAANEHFCIGTLGVGFDAHIAHLFAQAGKRGYSTYVKLVLTEFASYKEKRFSILVDQKPIERDCFLLTFANSSQFGNNAVIAPFADVRDGIIDISMMKRFPFYLAPALIYRLMHNSIHQSRFFEMIRGREIRVVNTGILQGHIDGEPVIFEGDIAINLSPLSLNVLVPAP